MSTSGGTCPICAGPLDAEGLCPSCAEGTFEGGPALSVDGTLASSAKAAPHLEFPTAEHTPPPPPAAPDPGWGVPLELDLPARPTRDDSLELDERALASARAGRAGAVIPSPPVQRQVAPRRRRWPWVLGALVVACVALGSGAAAAGRHLAEGLLAELLARMPTTSEKPSGPRTLEPGLAGEILMIDSEPGGAEVYLGDERLGTTPLAVDNPYADGERFEVLVKKPGYAPARLAAEGGGPAHLTVKLERARR